MNSAWKVIRKILGGVLILGGILGLFLPFFQGIAMIIAGAILLENEYILDKVKKIIAFFKKRSSS